MTLRIAILDDYQDIARAIVDWSVIPEPFELTAIDRHIGDRDELGRALAGHHVVVAMRERTTIDETLLARLPDLRLLVTTGPSNAAIDVAAAQRQGITVSGTGGYVTPTSELTWALILSLLRHVPTEDRSIRDGGWQRTVGTELAGRTLGLVGLGRLGALVAEVGLAFRMDVVAWSQNLTPASCEEVGARYVDRDELFTIADVVSVHLVLSDRTRGLIGERELRMMKPTAVLVNTSRGPIVDEPALIRALSEGWIAGAGLDVFDEEPMPPDHPFRGLENTVLTPHIGYVTDGLYRQFFAEIVEDIVAYLAGSPIRLVNA
jgi:phosphoglycerate dehydrogenase-like enzyme